MKDSIQPQRARRGMRWWIGRSALGLVIVLALALASGLIIKANLSTRYPPPGTLVDLGGYKLHIFCEGSGSPTVIMETGLGSPGLVWELVRPEVAGLTRTCVYDRAGLGWSDLSPDPRTAENMATELHALLSIAQIDGPYVLVGHSFGGALVRLYAHAYPEDVAGLVLVDASHEEQYSRFPDAIINLGIQGDQQLEQEADLTRPLVALDLVALFNEIAPPDPQLPRAADEAYDSFHARDSKMKDTEVAESLAFRANLEQVLADHITTLGDIPLIVLSRGQPTPLFDPALAAEVIEQMDRVWQQMQAELVQLSPQGEQVVATESGHFIQLDQPELVIEAIEHIVAKARQ